MDNSGNAPLGNRLWVCELD